MNKIKNKFLDRYIVQLSKTFISNAGQIIPRHAMRDSSGESACSTSLSAFIAILNILYAGYS
jgi:hypothetical protein